MIEMALKEDVPQGDVTTESLGLEKKQGTVQLVAKEDLILSGRELFEKTVFYCDETSTFNWQFKDGDLILKGQIVCAIEGNLIHLLKAERTALNFIGHLSGIASYTKCFVEKLKSEKTKILDTRKTLPLYRHLEKKAVADGGGKNHRMTLSDAILIKENHIRAIGNIKDTIQKIKENSDLPIEVETTNLDEVKIAVEFGADRIMLDNMSDREMKEALEFIPPQIQTEASGNITLERLEGLSSLGLDFVSVGAITHSAPNADFSLIFDWT